MATVLDSPVTTNSVGKLFHLDQQAADVITHLSGLFSIANVTSAAMTAEPYTVNGGTL